MFLLVKLFIACVVTVLGILGYILVAIALCMKIIDAIIKPKRRK